MSRYLSRSIRPISQYFRRSLSTPAPQFRPSQTPPPPFHGNTSFPHRQSPSWRPPKSGHAQSARVQSDPAWATDPRARLLLSYHDLERALERRGFDTARVLIGGGILAVAGLALSWPRIKRWGAAEGAEVAAASLQQQQLQMQAAVMVRELLQDQETGVHVQDLMKQAVFGLLEDKEFYDRIVVWTMEVLTEALTWDSLQKEGTGYLKAVFEDESSKESARAYLSDAVKSVVEDEKMQDTVANGLWSGFRASILGRRKKEERVGTNDAMNEPESHAYGRAQLGVVAAEGEN